MIGHELVHERKHLVNVGRRRDHPVTIGDVAGQRQVHLAAVALQGIGGRGKDRSADRKLVIVRQVLPAAVGLDVVEQLAHAGDVVGGAAFGDNAFGFEGLHEICP
ncbi:hypothetical protein D3C72_1576410 [compost metagenome]